MKRFVGINEHGRRIGQDHHNARLTDGEVELIRQLHDDGLSYKTLAQKFEVSKSTIQDIVTARFRSQFAVHWKVVRVIDEDFD